MRIALIAAALLASCSAAPALAETSSRTAIDLNNSNCITTTQGFGSTTVYNICTNERVMDVPWGGVDWMLAIVMGMICLLIVGVLGGLVYALVSELRR